nr:hypothetical protein [Lysinibacillus sphaericus]
MRKQLWDIIQNLIQNENGRDISLNEARISYDKLNEEMNQLFNEIKDAVDRNDYVKLMILTDRRKRLYAAIDAIESLYGADELRLSSNNNIVDEIINHEKMLRYHLQEASAHISNHFNNFIQKTLRFTGKE